MRSIVLKGAQRCALDDKNKTRQFVCQAKALRAAISLLSAEFDCRLAAHPGNEHMWKRVYGVFGRNANDS